MSRSAEDDGIEVIDVREMALVCLVDQHGNMRVSSSMYGKRQQAEILRTAADAADRQADDERSRS